MPHHDMSPLPQGKGPQPRPALEINLRGVHVRIDRLARPPRWVLTLLAGLAGAAASAWHLWGR
jgi:hypothetical protein